MVFLGVDKEALKVFIERLGQLHKQNTGDHIDFMSEERGPGDLAATLIVPGNHLIHHLKIMLIE